jgi:hypothetical protein
LLLSTTIIFGFVFLRRGKRAWDEKSRRLGCLRLGKFCFSSSTNPQDTQTARAGKPIPAAKKAKKLRPLKTHGGGAYQAPPGCQPVFRNREGRVPPRPQTWPSAIAPEERQAIARGASPGFGGIKDKQAPTGRQKSEYFYFAAASGFWHIAPRHDSCNTMVHYRGNGVSGNGGLRQG